MTADAVVLPSASGGLTSAEVAHRVAAGRVNRTTSHTERSIGSIVRANVLTPVNGIMVTLFALILAAGYWRDALFIGVVVANSVIGITQEVSARRELARLRVLSAPRAVVVRDGVSREVAADEVVVDDLVELRSGDQLVVDGEVVAIDGLEIDESLLTGESDPVSKSVGGLARSGSFVVAGSGRFVATAVGEDSYAAGLAGRAQQFTLVDSELQRSINLILKWLVPIIPVASILLFLSLYDEAENWQEAMQGTVAAAVAMVPDGLVLLTSLAFVAGVLALSRRQALAKQLATVEILARVDVLCLDKTGTITTGDLSLANVELLDRRDSGVPTANGRDCDVGKVRDVGEIGEVDDVVRSALAATATADPAPNSTTRALRDGLGPGPDWTVTATEPFSSARKWSSVSFDGRGTWILGAPDVLLGAARPEPDVEGVGDRVRELSLRGIRVVLFAHSAGPIVEQRLPPDLRPVALIQLHDTPREDASETLRYFREQGVELKVISGDNIDTVTAVADRVGIERLGEGTDARGLPDDIDELAAALEADTVFGRVVPEQKQRIVAALQSRGHVVGMTGDGVNDVLALKDANLGIAMGAGSAATRSVADLVLLDNRFSTLPVVVDEGRKVINNVERVSNLFIVKAVYAVLLTVIVALASVPFPLLPRQLTLIGTFSIGVPGYFLALAPERGLVRPGFLQRVLRFSLPAGIIAGATTYVVYEYARRHVGVELDEARTVATMTLLSIGLSVLLVVSRPIKAWKILLAVSMGMSYVVIGLIPPLRDFFELVFTDIADVWIVAIIGVAIASVAVALVPIVVPGLRGYRDTAPARK
ncbi:MAG: HAD-IC family P-type ATPase [Acidimicrobiia bacterium]|nr:HAD-IC family P-type ATPase [Acidimicrobiia bacterium]